MPSSHEFTVVGLALRLAASLILMLPGAVDGHPANGTTMNADNEYLASPKAMQDLRSINAQFIENFIHNDVKAHDALLHPDFIYVQSNGSRLARDKYLQRWVTGFDPEVIVYWDVRDELITLIGDVALVRSTNKYIVRGDGKDTSAMSTYTDTYIYQQGTWKCIQAQITPIAAGHEPSDDTIITVYIKGIRQNK